MNILKKLVLGLASLRKGQKPIRIEGERVKRNKPCTCGSGKKSKKCCRRADWPDIDVRRQEPLGGGTTLSPEHKIEMLDVETRIPTHGKAA